MNNLCCALLVLIILLNVIILWKIGSRAEGYEVDCVNLTSKLECKAEETCRWNGIECSKRT